MKNKMKTEKKTKNAAPILGYTIAFVATSVEAACDFANSLNAELKAKSLGSVLSLTQTYDGWWISVDDGNECIKDLIFDLGEADPEIQMACAFPSTKKLVGGDVISLEDSSRSLIRMILQLPDPEAATA